MEVTRFDRRYGVLDRRAAGPSEAPIKTASRIDVPKPFARVRPGTVAVAGVAWAQHRGIERVEVRVDGGGVAGGPARAEASEDTWRQWVWEWDAGGRRQPPLEVRATDADRRDPDQERGRPIPDGATGWHNVVVTARA